MAKKKQPATGFVFSYAEVRVTGGKKKNIHVDVDGRRILIPVSEELYANWQNQFVRSNPTPQQKKRFLTFMNVLRAAYQKGLEDGGAE